VVGELDFRLAGFAFENDQDRLNARAAEIEPLASHHGLRGWDGEVREGFATSTRIALRTWGQCWGTEQLVVKYTPASTSAYVVPAIYGCHVLA
jgi:hypothetical protein